MKVHYLNSSAINKIGKYLKKHLNENTAIICIGTDKCIVDSLGPLVGTMLKRENLSLDVYGTLEEPINALNFADYVETIKSKQYDNILALDACLSSKEDFPKGMVEVKGGPISPGKGVGKQLPEIGDVSIIGIIDSTNSPFRYLIEETSLSLVYGMSDVIAKGILTAMSLKEENKIKKKSRIEFNKSFWNIGSRLLERRFM